MADTTTSVVCFAVVGVGLLGSLEILLYYTDLAWMHACRFSFLDGSRDVTSIATCAINIESCRVALCEWLCGSGTYC